MSAEYLKLAVGNLAHRKTRSILTMIGIIIGIAAVIALISLGQGLETAVKLQFSALGSDRLIIQAKGAGFGPPGQNAAATLTKDDLETVQKAQYVRIAAGRLLRPVTVVFNDKEETLFAASVPDENADERALVLELTKPVLLEGRLLDINDHNKVLVGYRWARENRFDRPMRPGNKIVIDGTRFEVVGTLAQGGNPGFDGAIFLNERAMRDAVGEPDEYSAITARADSDAFVPLAIDAVTRDLRRLRDVKEREEDFTVQSSTQLLESVFAIISVIQAVLVGIAGISLIVGGIGIMNTMYTSVLQRTREVGIMKAIGATNRSILMIFLIEAAILGIIGGAIGIALGIGLAKAVEAGAAIALGPGLLLADIHLSVVLGALAFSMGVGIASGLAPAIQASRMEPVEALNS